MIFPFNKDLIMGFRTFNLKKNLFNLNGEDINTLDDEHVITAAHHPLHTSQCPPTGTRFGNETGSDRGSGT